MTKTLNIIKNGVKSNINKIRWFFIDRYNTLFKDEELTAKKKELNPIVSEEKKEEVKEETKPEKDVDLEAFKKELEELRAFKENTIKQREREESLKGLSVRDEVKKYLALILDKMEGESDKEKLNVIQKELPELFKVKEPEKKFEIKLEKMNDDDKEKENKIKDRANSLGIGIN